MTSRGSGAPDSPRSGARPGWDFGYAPVPTSASDDDGDACDVVVATSREVAASVIASEAQRLLPDARAEALVARAPVFWVRLRSEAPARRSDVEALLRSASLPVRYVASARRPSMTVTRLETRGATLARAGEWRPRRARDGRAGDSAVRRAVDPPTPGRWFLRSDEGGIGVDRQRFGGGAGTRLAVIDDDAGEIERLDLDAEVLVHLDRAPRAQLHGALLVAWAVGCMGFRGVAPEASPRLYCIPKPGVDVVSLPVAIVRAVADGADVIACATYVEGSTSPMLDDALELAARLGRGGRGTPIVIPTGREASSPAGSLHASWSLGFGEPASDPRVFCVGPSARGGGWFLWRDRKGRLRPFANRGPAVRWLAPGDDVAFPFSEPERLYHAESSGAAAVAAGALLLVLAANPALRVSELDAVVTRTLSALSAQHPEDPRPLADRSDVLPEGRDHDGHNAKHGYGRIHAGRACLAASDPIAGALVAMGEESAALAWCDARRRDPALRRAYSTRLARWGARALLRDPAGSHALRAMLRHLRLCAGHEERQRAHASGALLRQGALWLRRWLEDPPVPMSRRTADELEELVERALAATGLGALDGAKDDAERGAYVVLLRALWNSPDSSATEPRQRTGNAAISEDGDEKALQSRVGSGVA